METPITQIYARFNFISKLSTNHLSTLGKIDDLTVKII